MDKRSLINYVKYNKTIYNLYYWLGSLGVCILGAFVVKKQKRIVFSSFGGRKYDDSPRCIYEAMLRDPRFKEYELVWALGNPDAFDTLEAKKVKCDTFAYYKTLMSASVWVTNSTMERGLSFKPERIFNFNTWHGTTMKFLGSDQKNTELGKKTKKSHNDVMLAQSQYDVEIFSRVFNTPKENFRVIGLPRNDELVNCNTEENRKRIRKLLGIKEGKKVILYAPTFREYDKDAGQNCKLNIPVDLKKWEKRLGDGYVLLMRAHYEVVKIIEFEDNGFVKNVSSYPNLNELMIVSDILISDYSSIFIDYAVQDKPMLCFAYDYDKYATERGLYFDIREKLEGNSEDEDQLIDHVLNLNEAEAIDTTRRFRKEFVQESGNASKLSVDIIWNYLNGISF